MCWKLWQLGTAPGPLIIAHPCQGSCGIRDLLQKLTCVLPWEVLGSPAINDGQASRLRGICKAPCSISSQAVQPFRVCSDPGCPPVNSPNNVPICPSLHQQTGTFSLVHLPFSLPTQSALLPSLPGWE